MSIEQLWCKECKAIFDNIEEYNKFHNKPSVKVYGQKHSYISSKNNFRSLMLSFEQILSRSSSDIFN